MALQALKTLCQQLQQAKPLHIESPPEQPRRAAVAAILRCRPIEHDHPSTFNTDPITNVADFLQQPWVQQSSEPELLFIQRATRETDRWSGHVAFPGGKNEANETDEETAIRETMEEIGLDIGSSAFVKVGQLDEREITSTATGRLMMILTPFVFLQVVPDTPPLTIQESEVATVQWVPLRFFLSSTPYPDQSMQESIAPTRRRDSRMIAPLARVMLGTVSFPAIDLPVDDPEEHRMRLWGMTLGMTRELIELTCTDTTSTIDGRPAWQQQFVTMAAARPKFSNLDMQWLVEFYLRLSKPRSKTLHSSSLRKHRHTKETIIYITAFRRAIYTAVALRILLLLAGIGYLGRRLPLSRLIKLY